MPSTSTQCDCCGDEIECPGVLSCRQRGGVAELCGYTEFTNASTPPKKFRTMEQGGMYQFDRYTDGTCLVSTGAAPIICTWGGACRYLGDNCVLDEAGTKDCGGGPVSSCDDLGGDFVPGGIGGDLVVTSTKKQASSTGVCFNNGVTWGKYSTANQYVELTDEDTEDDAIARLMETSDWSEWEPCLFPMACCRAVYEERTDGFSFDYLEAEFKVVAESLTPGRTYYVKVNIWRRVAGTADPYELFQTVEVFGIADFSGVFEATGPVPNERGFETYASC